MFGLVPCLQPVGISSCLPLSYPTISFSVDLRLPATYSISDSTQRCSRVNQWPHNCYVLFPGQFQLVSCVPPSWCHFWCGPTVSSQLSMSTSSFCLSRVWYRLSFVRPTIQDRMSLLVSWLFWRLFVSIPQPSSYRPLNWTLHVVHWTVVS